MRKVGIVIVVIVAFALGALAGWWPTQQALAEARADLAETRRELASGQSDSERALEDALNRGAARLLDSEEFTNLQLDIGRQMLDEAPEKLVAQTVVP